MAVYNGQAYLEDAVESVLRQSFRDYEYLVVDDGSTDNTPSILKRYQESDSRIKLISKTNTGLADSLNVGLNVSCGEWVARLDADDIAEPDRLERQFAFVRRYPQTVLVGGAALEIDAEGHPLRVKTYPGEHHALVRNLECLKAFFPHSASFYRLQTVRDIGGYNRRFVRSQDYDLWLRLCRRGQIACLKDVVVRLRRHSVSLSNTQAGDLQFVMGIAALVCYFFRIREIADPAQMDQRSWGHFIAWLDRELLRQGCFKEIRAFRAVREHWLQAFAGNSLSRVAEIAGLFVKNPDLAFALFRWFFPNRYRRLAIQLTQKALRDRPIHLAEVKDVSGFNQS
jgi:glycosyltransferase involved in cell wall biosynthesis